MNMALTQDQELRSVCQTCPACHAEDTVDVFNGGELPVSVGVFYDSYSEAINAPLGKITLTFCRSCGLVFNREYDTSKDIFRPGYEVALHHSETFRKFIAGVAERLTSRFDLHGKRIVEIGCGDAYFLRALATSGNNHCTGIDPTVSNEGMQEVENGTVYLIRDYFGSKHQNIETDFICCLSVLEAIPCPAPFLAAVHSLASQSDAPLYFEVFNAWRAFQEQEVWSVHYEQCNYFGPANLRNIFAHYGFSIGEIAACYQGDQYLFVEAISADLPVQKSDRSDRLDVPEALLSFNQAYSEKLDLWRHRFDQYRADGDRVAVWGSGGKGITFLNTVEGAGIVEFVAEINPDKQGKFIPGSGQKIVSPEFLAEYQPDKIIITNALYEEEMKGQARDLGINAEFLIA